MDDVGYLGDYRRHVAVVRVPDRAANARADLLTCGSYEIHQPCAMTANSLSPTSARGEGVRQAPYLLLTWPCR
jgi:hypothetical protein